MHGKKRTEKSENSMTSRLVHELSLPENSFTGAPQIEMVGNREAVVDGCKKILEYDENKIRIDTGKLRICFAGQRLRLRCMTAQSAVVEGMITSIDFSN